MEFTWFNAAAAFDRRSENEASKGKKKRDLKELHFG
jgi:hypothetical protein